MFAAIFAFAFALASASGGAFGMTESANSPVGCQVSGADKALAEAGGPRVLCDLIKRAAKVQAPGVPFDVEVHAPSTYSLSAKVRFPDGRVLPELKMAVSDRRIDRGSIERFATAVLDSVVKARRQ